MIVDAPARAWTARAAALLEQADTVEQVVMLPLQPPMARATAAHARLDALLTRFDSTALEPAAQEGDALDHALLDERVRELRLDLVVDLGSGAADELDVEVWQLRHGDAPAGAPHALVPELLAGKGSCVTTLVRRSAEGDEVLYATRSLVRRLSLARTRDPILWKGAELPRRALDLRMRGARQPGPPVEPRRSPAPAPRAREIAVLEARLARRALAFAQERALKRWTWSIDWAECSTPATSGSAFRPLGSLTAPPGRFFADPFVVGSGGRHYVFYEDYDRSDRRASIAVALLEHGTAHAGTPVVSAPHHLSYPFVFNAGGEHYLVPESADAGVVQLFRATEFPYRWEADTTLLDGIRAYDATLLEHDGRWYLFAAVPVPHGDPDELHVFSAGDLRGPYVAHPLNPVVSDVSRARPAGRILRSGDGRLLRPGQDGAGGYGAAVVLCEIVTLTPDEYAERPVTRIAPDWAPRAFGTHTIDHDGSVQVMDLKRLVPRWT